jgi:hypothetical protein
MSTFKTIQSDDVYITPYNTKKSWQQSGSFSLGSYNLATYRGIINGDGYPNDININGYSDELVYKSISHLYYTGSRLDGTFSGSYDLALQTTRTISGSGGVGRSISDELAVISIPKEVYGDFIDPFSVTLDPPEGTGSLYVYDSDSGSYIEIEGAFDDYFESPTYISGGVAYTSSFFTSSAGGINVSSTIVDDGDGNLIFQSASLSDGSSINYYVGNVIYNQGQVIITNPTVARYYSTYFDPTISWKSNFPIYTLNVNCRVKPADYNASYNPTMLNGTNGDLKGQFTSSSFSPYVTTVGLYNDENDLLAVAKLSRPIRKSEDTEMIFKIQIDL